MLNVLIRYHDLLYGLMIFKHLVIMLYTIFY